MTTDSINDHTLNELLIELGQELAIREFGLGFRAPLERALQWLSEERGILVASLCDKRELLDRPESLAVTAVADIVTAQLHGVPANSVARVILKIGIDRYCREPDFYD